MNSRKYSLIKTLSLFVALTTLVLVGLGGYVRGTNAGLACPDWPLCHNMLFPKLTFGLGDNGVGQEVVHRYLALIVSLGVFGLTFLAFKIRKTSKSLFRVFVFLSSLILIQVVLGALTIFMKLNPFIVTAHLAFGTIILQTLFVVACSKTKNANSFSLSHADKNYSVFLYMLSFLVFIQIVLGGFVGSSGASMACTDIPFCNGEVYSESFTGAQIIQMVHRAFGTLLLLLAFLAIFTTGKARGIKRGHLIGVFFTILAQVTIGFLNVSKGIPVGMAVVHLILAQFILFSYLLPARRLSGKNFFN